MHHPKPGYQAVRHPKADFLVRPMNPTETCRLCKKVIGFECKVKDTEGPWLHETDMRNNKKLGSQHPRFCVYWRCLNGALIAAKNLEDAKAKGALVVKVTPEGKEIRGADATHIKPGFIGEDGNLYAYKDHDKESKVVIRTGQGFKV
jgi:hypothetical protein